MVIGYINCMVYIICTPFSSTSCEGVTKWLLAPHSPVRVLSVALRIQKMGHLIAVCLFS